MCSFVTEILFYHMQRQPLEKVLPTLVERSLARDWRAAIQASSPPTPSKAASAARASASVTVFAPHLLLAATGKNFSDATTRNGKPAAGTAFCPAEATRGAPLQSRRRRRREACRVAGAYPPPGRKPDRYV